MWATDEHTCRKLLAHTKLDLVAFRVLRAFWHKECRHLLQYLQSDCSEMETQEKQCCWKGTFKPGVLPLHFFVIEKKTCRFYKLIDGNKKNASVSALQLHRWVFVSITVNWNKWATWIFLGSDCQRYLLEPPCCLKAYITKKAKRHFHSVSVNNYLINCTRV